jgi:hypothetical protein
MARRAVEVCDPEDREPALGHFQEQLEDDDEPVAAVESGTRSSGTATVTGLSDIRPR